MMSSSRRRVSVAWVGGTLLAVASLVSCARRLAPVDVRAVVEVTDVAGVDKATAYSRALPWFESHDRAGFRVVSADPDTATISASIEMQCNSSVSAGLRAMGLGVNQSYVRSAVQFQAKDGRFRVAFTDLVYFIVDIRYASSSLPQGPATQDEVKTLYRECLQDLETSLVQAVSARVPSADF